MTGEEKKCFDVSHFKLDKNINVLALFSEGSAQSEQSNRCTVSQGQRLAGSPTSSLVRSVSVCTRVRACVCASARRREVGGAAEGNGAREHSLSSGVFHFC